MSDKVKKLPTNVSVIGSIDKQEMHAGVILKQVILSKFLDKVHFVTFSMQFMTFFVQFMTI